MAAIVVQTGRMAVAYQRRTMTNIQRSHQLIVWTAHVRLMTKTALQAVVRRRGILHLFVVPFLSLVLHLTLVFEQLPSLLLLEYPQHYLLGDDDYGSE